MKLATIASRDSIDLSHPARIHGRAIANLDFLVALLNSDELSGLDIYVSSPTAAQVVGRQLAQRLGVSRLPDNVRLPLLEQLPRQLERERYAAFHQPDPLLADLAWLRQELGLDVPLIGITHALSDTRFIAGAERLIAAPLSSKDVVVCTSEAAEQALEKLLSLLARRQRRAVPCFRRVRIPLGVTIETDPLERQSARARLGLPRDRTLVLSLGRVSTMEKMDLEPLMRVFKSLPRTPPTPQLVIAGALADPYERQRLPQLAQLLELDVLRVDPLSEPDKLLLYRACDVFVSLSDNPQESFGLTILEAMQAGLPVVASNWSAYRELVIDGHTGYLIPTLWADCLGEISQVSPLLPGALTAGQLGQSVACDVFALRSRLAMLCGDPALRQQLGEAGRKRAQLYRWPAVAKRYLQLVEQLNALDSALPPSAEIPSLAATPAPDMPASFSLFEVFGHYASHILVDGMTLPATARARRVIDGDTVVEVAAPLPRLHRFEHLMPMMLRAFATGANVGQVVELFTNSTAKLTRDDTLLCTMWLVKQGYLAFPPTLREHTDDVAN